MQFQHLCMQLKALRLRPCAQVKDSTIDVDQSALTGESLPVTLRGGDAAQMGATVVRGETHATGARKSF